MDKSPLERGVEAAGSQSAFAAAIGASQQNVSYWLARSKPLPAEYVSAAVAATGIPAHEWRPDLFNEDDTLRQGSTPEDDRSPFPKRAAA